MDHRRFQHSVARPLGLVSVVLALASILLIPWVASAESDMEKAAEFIQEANTAYEIPLRLVGSEMCIRDRERGDEISRG